MEGRDRASSDPIFGSDLHVEPIVGEKAAFGGLSADGEDGAIDAHVADLDFFWECRPAR